MNNIALGGSLPAVERTTGTWKGTVATVAAVLLALIYLVSGGWKLLLPFQAGELLEQAQVPGGWGTVGAAALGALEVFTAILLLTRSYRKLGGILGSALLLFFIGWIGIYYSKLVGHECSCFPLIKRTVGPGFFIGDAAMLLLGVAAFAWSPALKSLRVPTILLTSVLLFAGVSYGVNATLRAKVQVPTPVIVDGAPQNLAQGKVFLFFYDPECSHCDQASKYLSTLHWDNTRIIAIPTHDAKYAAEFLRDTHLKAQTSLEVDKLKKAFPFVDPPFGVALDSGHVKETFAQTQFNAPSPSPDLAKLGFIQPK